MPGYLTAGAGRLWSGTTDGVVAVDPATGGTTVVPDSGPSFEIGFGHDSVWTSSFEEGLIRRIDPATASVVATIEIPGGPGNYAFTDDGVWVTLHRSGSVSRIDPATNQVVATVHDVGQEGSGGPQSIAVVGAEIWVGVSNISGVVRIDPATAAIIDTIAIPSGATPCGGMLVTPAAVWMSSCAEQTSFTRIDRATNAAAVITTDGYTSIPQLVGDTVWIVVSNEEAKALVGFDPATGEAGVSTPLEAAAYGTAVFADALWLTNFKTGILARIAVSDLPVRG
ncbi:MAG: Vgb family protein [Ilumatobacteraceae bacterium]